MKPLLGQLETVSFIWQKNDKIHISKFNSDSLGNVIIQISYGNPVLVSPVKYVLFQLAKKQNQNHEVQFA